NTTTRISHTRDLEPSRRCAERCEVWLTYAVFEGGLDAVVVGEVRELHAGDHERHHLGVVLARLGYRERGLALGARPEDVVQPLRVLVLEHQVHRRRELQPWWSIQRKK